MNYKISAPAWHTANVILDNFELVRKPAGRVEPTAKNLAILIDVCTQIFRVEASLDNMLRNIQWQDKDALKNNLDQLQQAIKAVDMVRSRIPRYGDPNSADPAGISAAFSSNGSNRNSQAEATEVAQSVITGIEREKRSRISAALRGARTVDEEQSVLERAGIGQ